MGGEREIDAVADEDLHGDARAAADLVERAEDLLVDV